MIKKYTIKHSYFLKNPIKNALNNPKINGETLIFLKVLISAFAFPNKI